MRRKTKKIRSRRTETKLVIYNFTMRPTYSRVLECTCLPMPLLVLSRIVRIRHPKKKNVFFVVLLSLSFSRFFVFQPCRSISSHWHERYFPFFHSATCRVNLSKNYDNSVRLRPLSSSSSFSFIFSVDSFFLLFFGSNENVRR